MKTIIFYTKQLIDTIRFKKIFFAIYLTLFVFILKDQQDDFTKILPLSPNAASLGIYGDIPVGFFNGKANSSVPVYTIKTKIKQSENNIFFIHIYTQ
jgi:hypothetical protein